MQIHRGRIGLEPPLTCRQQPGRRQHPGILHLPKGVRPGGSAQLAVKVLWRRVWRHADALDVLPDSASLSLSHSKALSWGSDYALSLGPLPLLKQEMNIIYIYIYIIII